MLWRLAWRNLWRHRTRTLIAVAAVVVSYALLLLFLGLQDDLERGLEETAIETVGGHVFVHGSNYWETLDIERAIEDPEVVLEAVAEIAQVRHAAPRVVIHGLAETADESVAIQLTGVDYERERRIRDPAEHLKEGSFLDGSRDDSIVVGSGVADRLGIAIGDRVVVTAATPEGEIGRALFSLVGIVETGATQADDRLAWTSLEAARQVVEMEGQLNEIGLVLDHADHRHHVAHQLRDRFVELPADVEVRVWEDLLPDVVTMMQFRRSVAYIVLFALLIVVALAIANTFMMAVMERIRELGLLSAMGLTPERLAKMLLYESLFLAAIGLAMGFSIGLGLNLWIGQVGISFADVVGAEVDIDIGGVPTVDLVVYSQIVAWRWVASTVFVFAVIVASSLYPALRAARLSPADAMRMSE